MPEVMRGEPRRRGPSDRSVGDLFLLIRGIAGGKLEVKTRIASNLRVRFSETPGRWSIR